jgi:hypothetical protein
MNDCPMKVTEMYSVSFTMKGSVICSLRDKHCERKDFRDRSCQRVMRKLEVRAVF